MEESNLNQLKQFVEQCKSDPSLLSDPSLSFFRDYLESLGAKLPPSAYGKSKASAFEEVDEDMSDAKPSFQEVEEEEEEEDEIIESDIELEGETVEPDNDPPQKMGDSSVEVTDENREASQEAKMQAMEAISEGNLEKAIERLTEAITLNPTSAIMYATRATVYIKMKKPNAAIRDADAALEINPDSAKGYKSRGMARALLGQWEEAAKDLHVASKLDYDEEISTFLKKVEPNAHRIEEHRRKYDRLRKEREERRAQRERQRRKAEAQAAYESNDSDNISISQSGLTVTSDESGAGDQAKKIVLMFLERLSHPSGLKKSNKQQRNTEMVARILPALTYGEPAAMEALVQHFDSYLQDWTEFNQIQKQHEDNPKDENIAQQAMEQRFAVENFVRVSESLKTSSCGERLKLP